MNREFPYPVLFLPSIVCMTGTFNKHKGVSYCDLGITIRKFVLINSAWMYPGKKTLTVNYLHRIRT